MTTAKVETVEDGCCIGRSSSAVLHVVGVARLHAGSCNQRERTADGSLEREGDKVVARCIGKGIVTSALVADGTGDEGITLLGIRDSA